jgi:hypothetical protein
VTQAYEYVKPWVQQQGYGGLINWLRDAGPACRPTS